MLRFFALFIMMCSLLAIANAATIYKRSTYFETKDRVNLQRIIDNIDTLEQNRLLVLSRQLVRMSDADHATLNLISHEFRRAIIYLIVCLLMAMLYTITLLIRYRGEGIFSAADSDQE